MAPYVAKTLVRNVASILEIKYELDPKVLKEEFVKKADEFIHANTLAIDHQKLMTIKTPSYITLDKLKEYLQPAIPLLDEFSRETINYEVLLKKAQELTERDTDQALESLVHNLCTMNSRAGSQTPFSSVNFGTDTSWEGRTISWSLLKAIDKGLGHGEVAIFPISIFKMKKGITDKGSPNYDLYHRSCEVSARRLFPNWVNLDAPYNLQYYKPEDPNTQAATMGALAYGKVSIRTTESITLDISEVKDFILNHPELIEGEPKFIDFDEHTKYVNLKPGALHIQEGHEKDDNWVSVKKYMFWNDPNAKWFDLTYTYSDIQGVSHKNTLRVTDDHPLRVARNAKWERIFVKDMHVGDILCTNNSRYSDFKVTTITAVHNTEVITGYDFETESDMFNVEEIVSFNCRTRVISNIYNPEKEIYPGRGNLFWTTINLPYIALEAKESMKGQEPEIVFETFLKRLEEVMDDVIDFSYDRFNIIARTKAHSYPFSMGQHEYVGSESLKPDDPIESVIKNGSITVGFIGLAETLIALFGKHHAEDEYAQRKGLEIIRFMRERTDREAKRAHLNFSLMASPAEGCTGRLRNCIQKRFGDIPRITDKKYLVNSTHRQMCLTTAM